MKCSKLQEQIWIANSYQACTVSMAFLWFFFLSEKKYQKKIVLQILHVQRKKKTTYRCIAPFDFAPNSITYVYYTY